MLSTKIKKTIKKISVSFILCSILFLSGPQQASAQLVTANPDILGNDLAMAIQKEAQDKAMGALTGATAALLINALNYGSTLIAQSTAQWIVDGGAGKHPLFNPQTAEQIKEGVAATITSDVVEQLVPGSRYLAALGLGSGSDNAIRLARRFLTAPYLRNAQKEFDGSEIGRNFGAYLTSAASVAGAPNQASIKILNDMANGINANEFFGLMRVYGQTQARASQSAAFAQFSNVINANFRDLTDPISGAVRWPARAVRDQLDRAIAQRQANDAEVGRSLVAAAGRDALIQVGINFASTFLSTLAGGLTQKLFDGLLADIEPITFNPFDPQQVGPQAERRDMFRSLGTFRPLEAQNFNLISQLASCPAGTVRDFRGVYTCAMNTSFLSVISRGSSGAPMTLAEAIEENYIDKDWKLIGPNESLNRDATCSRTAFCYSNLVKMRKARIIPIGWEMAAELSGNGRYSLGEVMDGFYSCNSEGRRDSQYPFCNLIDPNWIIKAPEAICRTMAYGQQLTAAGVANRAEECVDIQTCVAEDANGNCIGGYGYCVREKNVWRFRGDACDPQYASCQTVTNTETNQRNSYLLSTVDYAECGPDEVGCLWHATQKTVDDEGNFDWPIINNLDEDSQDSLSYENRIYFNNQVEECDQQDSGCTRLIVRDSNLTLNMIQNPSFRQVAESNQQPVAWFIASSDGSPSGAPITLAEGEGFGGSAALNLDGTRVNQYGLNLRPGFDYSISLFAKSSGTNNSLNYIVEFRNSVNGESITNLSNLRVAPLPGSVCSFNEPNGTLNLSPSNNSPLTSSYQRYGCTFTAPLMPTLQSFVATTIQLAGNNVFVEDIQLEQAGNITTFASGYSSASPNEFAKLPPNYLGCTGGPNDPPECSGFTRMCNPLDEGCRRYSPRNGDPVLTAIPGSNDFCPAACVGYDTFKQEPTNYEPNGLFPVHFIASTADTCPLGAVGCDEFTNLSTEAREYFTELRACQTRTQAGSDSAIYYTWEGSEESGFQLRVWNLLKTNISGVVYGNNINAPCTNWSANEDGTISCNDDSNTNGLVDSLDVPGCRERADIFNDPDCREFYDSEGNIHYRRWSQTVSINNQCTRYRKTTIAGDDQSSRQNACESAGGYFDSALSSCLFSGLASESQTCSAQHNGCRLYTGGRSNNARIVLNDNLEAGTLSNWQSTSISRSTESLSAGGHSLLSEGNSFWTSQFDLGGNCGQTGGCAGNPSIEADIECTILEGQRYCGALHNQLAQGKTYTLTFWARGTGSLTVDFANEDQDNFTSIATLPYSTDDNQVPLTIDWRQYRLGPLDTSNLNDFGNGTVLQFNPTDTLYIDNIVLREGEENLTLIRDSWVTPAVCDTNNIGQFTPQFHLGCQLYDVSSGGTATLKSFNRLCSDSAVGCSAYFNTQNNESPYTSVRNAFCNRLNDENDQVDCHLLSNSAGDTFDQTSQRLCTIRPGQDSCRFNLDFGLNHIDLIGQMAHLEFRAETELIPADQPIYAIIEDQNRCNPANIGCSELGIPQLSPDRTTVESWSSTNLIVNPANFNQTLCGEHSLFCSAFDTQGNQGTLFFRDPGNQICEYRTGVQLAGRTYNGWFRQGTNNFCYGDGTCNESGDACSTDSDCRPTSGTCSVSGNACSQDAECGANERCLDAPTDTCNIVNPGYLRSGTISGIWNNGDEQYGGWVGTCPPGQSGCRQFTDPLDVPDNIIYGQSQSTSYYYIENENIGDRSAARGQRCNGQFSLESGCTLFHDTSIPNLTHNSSATSILSRHADIMLGQEPFSLVNPLNCEDGSARSQIRTPNGSVIDLCSQRCVYNNFELNDRTSTTQNLVDAIDLALDGSATILTSEQLEEVYTFGGSCLTNNDCTTIRSQKGDLIDGKCLATVVASVTNNDTVAVPRLTNDSNRVLRVDRDRTCSEWVTADACRSVWDPDLGQFRDSCSELILCQGYESGNAGQCAQPKMNDVDKVINLEYYTSRDTSWHGTEYSGHTIPDQFLMHQLSQFLITPANVCANGTTGEVILRGSDRQPTGCDPSANTTGCNANEICISNPDPKYALVYNAGGENPANLANGASCTIGFCTDSGSPCANDDACLQGVCAIGYCMDQFSSCSDNSDCAAGQACRSGVCEARSRDVATVESPTCAPGQRLSVSSARRTGTWINDRCILNPDGGLFRFSEAEEALCRAHPEINSPFGNDLVTNWKVLGAGRAEDISGPLSENAHAYPFNIRSGFEQVNLCGPGEVCECSYTKVATSGGQTGYIAMETTTDTIIERVIESGGFKPRGVSALDAGNSILGICSGGISDGAFCVINGEIEYGCAGNDTGHDPSNPTGSTGGICNPISREDTLLGLRGYCLERDTSVTINGDQDLGACLTWYPVDELLGDTDLNAKHKSAGFFEDNYQCAQVEIRQSISSFFGCSTERGVANLAQNTPFRTSDGVPGNAQWDYGCAQTAHCPDGFFAVVGGGNNNDNPATVYADSCNSRGINGFQRNSCPYLCIPIGSVNNSGQTCEPPEGPNVRQRRALYHSVDNNNNITVRASNDSYFIDNSDEAEEYFDAHGACVIYGLDPSGSDTGIGALSYTGENGYSMPNAWNRGRTTNTHLGENTDPPLHPSGEFFYFRGNVNQNFNSPRTRFPLMGTSGSVDYQLSYPEINYYPVCTSIIKLASTDHTNTSAPRTNVLLADQLINEEEPQLQRVTTWGYEPLISTPNKPYGSLPSNRFPGSPYGLASCVASLVGNTRPNLTSGNPPILRDWNQASTYNPTGSNISWLNRALQLVPPLLSNNSLMCPNYNTLVSTIIEYSEGYTGSEIAASNLQRGFISTRNENHISDYRMDNQIGNNFWPVRRWIGADIRRLTSTSPSNAYRNNAELGFVFRINRANRAFHIPLSISPSKKLINNELSDYIRLFYELNRLSALPLNLYGWIKDPALFGVGSYSNQVDIDWSSTGQPQWGSRQYSNNTGLSNNLLAGLLWDTRSAGSPPIVKSVDFLNCRGTNCREAREGAISVNRQDIGDQEYDGYARLEVEFFAMADKDQLPLRRIIIDWGHTGRRYSGSDSEHNFFKNFRGLDSNNDQICNQRDEWGKTAESCEPNFFRASRIMICNAEVHSNLRECGNPLTDAPCAEGTTGEDDAFCVFRPAVHIRDNWGWCSGTCNGNDGCFSGQYGLDASSAEPFSQCSYEEYPLSSLQSVLDPWIRYDGIIRIRQQ